MFIKSIFIRLIRGIVGSQPARRSRPRPPPAPQDLCGELIDGALRLEWEADVADEDGFVVERRSGCEREYQVVAELPEVTTSYHDDSVQRGQVYLYRVKAISRGGASVSETIRIGVM